MGPPCVFVLVPALLGALPNVGAQSAPTALATITEIHAPNCPAFSHTQATIL
jgi:hypothetical protein